MKTPIETQHLILREFNLSDAPFVFQLVNTPTWLQFIGDRNIANVSDAEQYLADGPMKSYLRSGFGFYLVQLKSNGTPIGLCGLVKREFLSDPDLGFAFLPEFTGCGYAYEASLSVLTAAKNDQEISRILAITSNDNERSIRLLKKLNFIFEKMIKLGEGELKLYCLNSAKV